MESPLPFHDLIRRVRAGDEEAAAVLVRQYEPEVRRAIRMFLTDPRLRRFVDSGDIFQSVLAIFFGKVIEGAFDLSEPSQLVRLLVKMAHDKFVDHKRKSPSHKETDASVEFLDEFVGREETPSHILSQQELASALRAQLSDEERRIAELRAAGHEWAEIGAAVGSSADAVRKKLNKAIGRVCDQFGLNGEPRA